MPSYVLGISDSHCATACLLKDGKIVACASEERFTRAKNHWGFPLRATRYCLEHGRISGEDLDLVVFSYTQSAYVPGFRQLRLPRIETARVQLYDFLQNGGARLSRSKLGRSLVEPVYLRLSRQASKRVRQYRIRNASDSLGISQDKVIFLDHHTAHAYSAIYSSPYPSSGLDALVFTCDGYGDYSSATVWKHAGDGMERIASTFFTNSLGFFYQAVTGHLGLKELEDEYKIMGLAGYVISPTSSTAYQRMSGLFRVLDDLSIQSDVSILRLRGYLDRLLSGQRFDEIAGAAQQLLEETVLRWVSKAIDRTHIKRLAVAGGTFMNVKVNMKLASLDEVESVFVMPSAGDESSSVGAAYYGFLQLHPEAKIEPLGPLYLGPDFPHDAIVEEVEAHKGTGWVAQEFSDINLAVGELLSKGKMVARMNGRMEFGARALGNRSILADAEDLRVVASLNRTVKMRDFWMPYSPVILNDSAAKYVSEPRLDKTDSEYMVFAYKTKEAARVDIPAAMHQFDYTIRPQILQLGWNHSLFQIVDEFAKKSGRRALINTSFNLHGEPIVCSPSDAISTFERSGLQFLALGDYLLSKSQT